VTPDRPFFMYYAPGATHAPHHVPKEWIVKFKGKFDQGWDKYREEAYKRQLQLGVIPADAKLTPRPKEIPAWDSLNGDQKRVAARLMETFAAYTAQTDYEVGRVVDALHDAEQLENTLVIWEIGDNGASMEGTLSGVFNEMSSLNGVPEDTSYVVKHSMSGSRLRWERHPHFVPPQADTSNEWNGSVAHRLSEFHLAFKFFDFTACSGLNGREIECHLLDLASECVRRFVVRADRRAGIHTYVECFVGREATRNSLVHSSFTYPFVIYVQHNLATLSEKRLGT
jgi:hypothetical protein